MYQRRCRLLPGAVHAKAQRLNSGIEHEFSKYAVERSSNRRAPLPRRPRTPRSFGLPRCVYIWDEEPALRNQRCAGPDGSSCIHSMDLHFHIVRGKTWATIPYAPGSNGETARYSTIAPQTLPCKFQ